MEKIGLSILIVLHLLGFLVMGLDKYFAIRQYRRISERHLLMLALFGASIGIYIGMVMFRHKTQQKAFNLGVPVMMAMHFFLYYLLIA